MFSPSLDSGEGAGAVWMKKNKEPFSILLGLANRSLSNAKGLPEQVEATRTWTGVAFILGGQTMVAPMAEVAELMHVPGWTSMPGVKNWVKGIANVRGRLLPMIDTEAYFGGNLSGNNKTRRVIAVECNQMFVGLIVSEVIGMQHFPVDTFVNQIPKDAAPFVDYTTGAYVHENKTWTVFSPFKLAKDRRFVNAAA
jgi:twitching motility protein PilI